MSAPDEKIADIGIKAGHRAVVEIETRPDGSLQVVNQSQVEIARAPRNRGPGSGDGSGDKLGDSGPAPGLPPITMVEDDKPLVDKEKDYYRSAIERISPLGMYHYQKWAKEPFHSWDHGDACAHGGILIQALSFKYACTEDKSIIPHIAKLISFYERCYAVSKKIETINLDTDFQGRPIVGAAQKFYQHGTGQLCRMVVEKKYYEKVATPEQEIGDLLAFKRLWRHMGKQNYKFDEDKKKIVPREQSEIKSSRYRYFYHDGYYYQFDTSKDQYAHALAGLLICERLVPDLKSKARGVLNSIRAQLEKNQDILKEDGEKTDVGELAIDADGDGDGDMNPILHLLHFAADTNLKKFSLKLVKSFGNAIWGTPRIARPYATYYKDAKDWKKYFAYKNMFFNEFMFSSLLMAIFVRDYDDSLNSVPASKKWVRELLSEIGANTKPEFNPYMDVLTGGADRLRNARRNLYHFPPFEPWRKGMKGKWSKDPVDPRIRQDVACFWERSPYYTLVEWPADMVKAKFPELGRRYTNAHDYLLAYWLYRITKKLNIKWGLNYDQPA